MNSFKYIFILVMCISSCHSKKTVVENTAGSPELLNHWIHSYEEDNAGIMFFRPSSYNFPLSRGREGLEFLPGGEFHHHMIGTNDQIIVYQGNWLIRGKNIISISYDNPDKESVQWEIITVTGAYMKIRKNE